MVEIDENLYPISNIKNIAIDRENLKLTVYFKKELNLYPVVMMFNSGSDLEEKVRELTGHERRKRTLLG